MPQHSAAYLLTFSNLFLPLPLPLPLFPPFFSFLSISNPSDRRLSRAPRRIVTWILQNGSVPETLPPCSSHSFAPVSRAFVGNLDIESRRVAAESRLQDFCKSRSIFYERRRSSFSVHRLPSNRIYHRVHTLSS